VQSVTVDKDVKLEVLDWGGSGRPLVLLAGQGDTAHIFDEFAPKLTSEYHVYGVTRRGYGASSVPESGYSADRLGDDVLAVLDTLKLDRPVLVGHSIAGEELSSIGSRHPERVAGLIYLDAGYSYAFYDGSRGDLNIDLRTLQRELDQLQPGNGSPEQMQLGQNMLQRSLPAFERDLREPQEYYPYLTPPPTPPAPTDADRVNYQAWQSWQKQNDGWAMPEGELRQIHETTPEGHVGDVRINASVQRAVTAGEEQFTDIRDPVLAIFALPHDLGPFVRDESVRAQFDARDIASTGAQVAAFEKGIPSADVVRLPHAAHYVFLSNEADVLREMRAFIERLN
jgi:non-heme chloroperoxidase